MVLEKKRREEKKMEYVSRQMIRSQFLFRLDLSRTYLMRKVQRKSDREEKQRKRIILDSKVGYIEE
jgi:hypothetical protein